MRGKWWVRHLIHVLPIVLLLSLLPVSLVQAGGVGISGTFSGQHFYLTPGESLNTPDIYVVVFNNSDSDMEVKLTPQTPPGVELILSTTDFLLQPGSQQRIEVGVAVSPEAVPGEYILALTAEACPKGEGVKLAGAAKLQANLTILGEAGSLVLSTVTPEGKPFPATVTLYRKVEGRNVPCGRSESGRLEARLPPGDYLAEAYFQDTKVAEDTFNLAADEKKEITLVSRTVFLEGFGVVPNYHRETGEIAFVQIVYTVRNLYQPVAEAEVVLEVNRDGAPLEEISLATLSPLDMGRVGLNYSYIPSGGWVDGSYGFRLRLKLDGKPYATTLEEQFNVSVSVAPEGGMSPAVIGGMAGGVVIVAGGVYFLVRRRRRA